MTAAETLGQTTNRIFGRDRIHLGTFTGPAGTFRQCTELPRPARDLLARLSVETPRKIHELTAGT